MDYIDYDPELAAEGPCQFCGESYPLFLLWEHQTTHLNEGGYPYDANEDDNSFPELIFETEKNEPEKVVEKIPSPVQEPKKVEENIQMKSPVDKPKKSGKLAEMYVPYTERTEEIFTAPALADLYNTPESKRKEEIFRAPVLADLYNTSESKPKVTKDAIPAQPPKASNRTTETKQNQHKSYPSQAIKELTTEKGEKLLVYGADIDHVEDSEGEKQSYKMPDNPLLNAIPKEDDVEDISNLSDDDCDESLEEFWKRARDFLKRNRRKNLV